MLQIPHSLVLWGWNNHFTDQLDSSPIDWSCLARVTSERRDHYLLINGQEQSVGGILTGAWRKKFKDFENPCVGDWVQLGNPVSSQKGIPFFLIEKRFHRSSQILRKAAGSGNKTQILAANVDLVFLVTSCNHDFDLKRLERYLSLLGDGQIKAHFILTKGDLDPLQKYLIQLQQRFPKIPILNTRQDDPNSLETVRMVLKTDETAVFLGSSGVGKSTLINYLLGESKQRIQGIRHNDSKGKHTTTHRSLHQIPKNGGLVIDTPGLREVQLPFQENNLEEAFGDLVELSLQCRFPDCGHLSEPNCAIKKAVSEGLISQERLNHYNQLNQELRPKLYGRKK